MSSFVDQFKYGFHGFYGNKRTFQLSAEISIILLGGATVFDGIGKNFEKFLKTDGNVCENDSKGQYRL